MVKTNFKKFNKGSTNWDNLSGQTFAQLKSSKVEEDNIYVFEKTVVILFSKFNENFKPTSPKTTSTGNRKNIPGHLIIKSLAGKKIHSLKRNKDKGVSGLFFVVVCFVLFCPGLFLVRNDIS